MTQSTVLNRRMEVFRRLFERQEDDPQCLESSHILQIIPITLCSIIAYEEKLPNENQICMSLHNGLLGSPEYLS